MSGAKIRLYDRRTERSYDFGLVQSITIDYASGLTAIPIIILGPKNTLMMDSGGVSKTYRIAYTRISPAHPSASDSRDTSNWSNKDWRADLKATLSHWQMRNDGFQFTLEMDKEMKDCFPDLNDNVYVTSVGLPISNESTMSVSGSISLSVGSIRADEAKPVDIFKVIYHANDPMLTPSEFDTSIPKGAEGTAKLTVTGPRAEWIEAQTESNKRFMGWYLNPDGIGDMFMSGVTITIDSNKDFFAKWSSSTYIELLTSNGIYTERTYTFKENTTYAYIIAIGAGGGGGLSSYESKGKHGRGGGAGGNGGHSAEGKLDLLTMGTKSFKYRIGKGGAGASRPGGPLIESEAYNGSPGEDTVIVADGGITITGKGGAGGSGARGGTPGEGGTDEVGTNGGKGGSSLQPGAVLTEIKNGADGQGDYGGKGGKTSAQAVGGGGGGSPKFVKNGEYFAKLPESKRPRGGNGQGPGYATDGFNAGGGGGGLKSGLASANGGDGMILVIEVREE